MRCAAIYITALALSYGVTAAQNRLPAADAAFHNGDYGYAVNIYLAELKKDDRNPLLNYKTGVCYLHSRSQKYRAVPYLEKASAAAQAKREPAEVPADVTRLLGDAYYHARQYGNAVGTYEKYRKRLLESEGAEAVAASNVDHYLEISRYAGEIRQKAVLPVSAGSGKPCAAELKSVDYTVTPSADKSALLYTFSIPLSDSGDTGAHDSRYFEVFPGPAGKKSDTLTAKKTPAKPVRSKLLESDTIVYAGTLGTSVDGQVILTYRSENGNAGVYISRLQANRWSAPLRVGKPVNRQGWEPHEWVSADGCILLFASDRPGGFGGKDLYRCEKQADGKWGKAVNLGEPINSAADETAPFIHPDGKTLLFSSNRVKPGNHDIFSCRLDPADWGRLVNAGYPVNRNDRDIFQVTADKRKIYAASEKNVPGPGRPVGKSESEGETGRKKTADDAAGGTGDNFLITINDQYRKAMTLIRGRVLADETGTPLKATITVIDNASGKSVATYYSDETTGDYAFVLPPGTDCHLRFEAPGRLTASEHALASNDSNYFATRAPVLLPQLKEGAALKLNNIFFREDFSGLTPSSATELQRLNKMLAENPYLKGEIACTIYTDDNRKAGRKSATQKATLVAQALYEAGISKQRLTAKGYSRSIPAVKKKRYDKKVKPGKHAPAAPPETLEFRIRKL